MAPPFSETTYGQMRELTRVGKDLPDTMLSEPYMVRTRTTCYSVCVHGGGTHLLHVPGGR